MLHNWVLHVQRLGLPILVSAMDKDVVQMAVALATADGFLVQGHKIPHQPEVGHSAVHSGAFKGVVDRPLVRALAGAAAAGRRDDPVA